MSKKKPFYVSLNRLELDLLADASYEEVTLYVTILKRMANFKTGLIGTFQKEALTYEDLAGQLSRPCSQGKPAQIITRDRARDLVRRLESRGLASNVQVLGKTLILLLPLSPINYDSEEVPTDNAKQSKESVEKRLQTSSKQNVSNADGIGLEDVLESASTVLTNTIQSHNTQSPPLENTDSRADSWVSNGGEAQESEDIIGNIFADDNTEGAYAPSIVQMDDIHPPLEWKVKAHFDAPPFSAESIGNFLRGSGILHAETTLSKSLYKRWLRAGVTYEQLEEAVEKVNGDMTVMQTPHSVDTALSQQRINLRGSGRGRVVL